MATFDINFSYIFTNLSEILGLGSSPTWANLTKVKEITLRGYIKFLTPIHPKTQALHVWSFLQKRAKLPVGNSQYEYILPENFWLMLSDFTMGPNSVYIPATKIKEEDLRGMQSELTRTGAPEVFSVVAGDYDPSAPQRKNVLFYPTPDASFILDYSYIFMPPKLVNDADYFVGGPALGDVIRLCALSVAEMEEDETQGPMSARATNELFKTVLADERSNASATVGVMRNGNGVLGYNTLDRKRALQYFTEVYGVAL